MSAAKNLGLLRLMTAASAASDLADYTDHAREQMQMLTNKNSLSPTYLDEMGHIKTNFERALGAGSEGLAAAAVRGRREQENPRVARAAPPPGR